MTDKVLELGGYAAAYCGRLFQRAGADVVRVEAGAADPAWASDEAMSLYLHAGKRRVATSDPQLIARLAGQADVVIFEGHIADEVASAGFDEWSAPVKVALTPFGRTGPKANWKATPGVLLAMGGYTYLIGDADRQPLTLPGHYLEFQSGAMAYLAADAARLAGRACCADISMLEVLMSLSQFTTVRWHCLGDVRSRHGSDFWFVSPSDLFRVRDGWVYVNVVPQFWDPFVVMLDRAELTLEDRFATNDGRMTHRAELKAIIVEALAPLTRAEVEARAIRCRVPLGVLQTFAEVLQDPHLSARGAFETLSSGHQTVRSPRVPYLPDRGGGAPLPLADIERG